MGDHMSDMWIVRDKYHGNDNLPNEVSYAVSKLRWYVVNTETGYLHTTDFAEKSEAQAAAAELNKR
jgi:hypothetical protein